MKQSKAKQYLPLNGSTVLEQTLSCFLNIPSLAKIVLVLDSQDEYWSELPLSDSEKIVQITGGKERFISVLNALTYLKAFAEPDDWVLVHDAARPCITSENIQKLIDTLQFDPVGGILAVPVSDTLKSVVSENNIDKTVDRTTLWQAQTPQMFRYQLLVDSLFSAKKKGLMVTDEASAIEAMGHQAKVVEGRRDNIKVTLPEDLVLAQLILDSRN